MPEEKKFDFEAKLKELEAITAWLESDDANLDQALAKFERGMELSAELKTRLAEMENRVEKIKLQYGDDQAA